MDPNARKQGSSFFGAWLDWSRNTVTIRLSILLVAATALHVISNRDSSPAYAVFLGELIVFAVAILLTQYLAAFKSAPRVQAAVASSCMILFILVAALTVAGPGTFMLLFIPVINAALRLTYRHTLMVTVACGLIWVFLRSQEMGGQFLYFSLFAELLPLVLVAVVVKALSGDVLIARNRITALSYQDELTGLLNMRAFTRLLQSEHQKAEITESTYAILMIDIDGLQALNDSYGHEQGNRVLVAVGDALKRSIRSADLVARYGGDEFVIYLSGADDAAAQEVCNRVSQNVYNITLSFERKMQRVRVNVGMAIYPDSGATIQEIMTFADRAMYRDKEFHRRTGPAKNSADEGREQAGVEYWD